MGFYWKPYVPVAQRRAKAKKEIEQRRKKGMNVQPVQLDGRTIARSFWGMRWCEHLESFSDFENRLPRGRTYVRNGSVCHLEIKAGRIEAMVCGSELYKIVIKIQPLKASVWESVKNKCRGQIGSLLELLQGRLSDHVMTVVSHREHGLFPRPGEIELDCSCPDWASMCKHVAAVLYGVGSRLDSRPELLFILRGVEAAELIAAEAALPTAAGTSEEALAEAGLAEIFGIDLDTTPASQIKSQEPRQAAPAGPRRSKQAPRTASKPERKLPVKRKAKKWPSAPEKPRRIAANELPTREGTLAKAPAAAAGKTQRSGRTPLPTGLNPNAPAGAAIARLRTRSGLSEAQFAKTLGVSAATVRRWEANSAELRIHSRPLAALLRFQSRLTSGKLASRLKMVP